MRIASSGNVGIGTTNPGAKLEIVDVSNPGATSGSVIIEGRRDGSPNVLTLRAKDASDPTDAIRDGQGPVVRFQGFDGTDFENMGYIQVAADGQAIADSDAPSFMGFGTSADGSSAPTEKMRITSGGNVGIGTTDPTQKLHVAGNARVTGKYHDSNDNPGLEGQVLKTKVVNEVTTGTDWDFVTWTPDIWQVNPTTSALTAAATLVCDTVPVYEGTTQTSGIGASAGEIRILDAGLYEINYSVAINVTDTNVSTRQVVALYLTAHPLNGSEIKIPGSLNSTYLRLPGTNQGGGTSFSNTVYYGVPVNTDIALKIDWIDGNTKSVNIVEPFSIQNTISIRRIGEFVEPE